MLTTSIPLRVDSITAQSEPKIFVDPSIVVDTNKTVGTSFTVNIGVSDIPSPGLVAYEFYLRWNPSTLLSYPLTPITNGNFTSSTDWTTTVAVTNGTATYDYDMVDGNPSPGSDAPSYFHRANSSDLASASITFTTEQSVAYNFGRPNDVLLSYAFKVSGNSIASGGYMRIMVVKPSGSTTTLKTVYSIPANGVMNWTFYGSALAPASAFSETGTYKFRLVSLLKTAAPGVDNYVQANWDDVQVKLVPIRVSEGPFLKQGGTTYFTVKYFEEGYIYVFNSLTGTPYVTFFPQLGSGTIANVTFYVEGYNETALDLHDTILLTIGLPPAYPPTSIDHTSEDGYFCNIPGIVHDVAVTNIVVSPTMALDGQPVSVNVTVENQGNRTETFTVSAYYNSSLIQTQTVSNLAGGANILINYSWNTAGVAPGTYTIKAVASSIPGETDKADNTFIDGTVTVSYTHNVAILSVTPSKTSIYLNETITITVVAKNKGTTTETLNVTVFYATFVVGTQTVTNLAPGVEQPFIYTWDTTGVSEGSYQIKAVASNVTGEIYTADNTYLDGIITINPIRDIAVISVSPSPTTVNIGQNVTITVVVKNEGTKTETFPVATYYDSFTIEVQSVYSLAPGATTTLTFMWNTTLVAPGTYTIKAEAAMLLGETDIADNILIDGTVNVGRFTYNFTTNGYTAQIIVETNSSITAPLTLDEQQKMLTFNVTGPSGRTGFANVTVPTWFMWGPWVIYLDGSPYLTMDPPSNGTHTSLYFTYPLSTRQIQIQSTGIVPEFPFEAVLLLILLAATGAGAVVGKKKASKKRRGSPIEE